jgi:ABC-type multidrug transport system ATPase subunit
VRADHAPTPACSTCRRHRRAARIGARRLRHLAAVLEGNRNLYWRLTASENLTYFAGNRGMPPSHGPKRIDELLERFGLGREARRAS